MIGLKFILNIFSFYPQIRAQADPGELGAACCVGIIVIIIIAIISIILILKWIFGSKQEVNIQQQPPQQQPPPVSRVKPRGKPCPDCSKSMEYIKEYDKWYCDNCEEYK
ncbi:MAG: hypothetical protein ACOC6U_01120 [Thermoplasmatota archaeon]